MAELTNQESKRAEKDLQFRLSLFFLRIRKRENLINKFQSDTLSG